MAYSYAQLKALWMEAGGNSAQADIAAAVALAESGGDANAKNVNTDGSIDRGLWQINSVHGAQSTFDPLANAKAAISISGNGKNWSPWTTFQSGAYKKFMSPTTPADSSMPSASTSGIGISGIGGISVSGLVQSAVKALLGMFGLSDLKDMLERAGLIILGFALVILGIHLLGQQEAAKGQVVNVTGGSKEEGGSTKKAAEKNASKTGASEAVEAAAVA